MKLRLFACIALAMMVAGVSAVSSRIARGQDEGSKGQGERSERDRGRSEGSSADIDKALRAYDERMDRNLDKCRQDLEQMKKELHELIDLRLSLSMSLAESHARHGMSGGAFGRPGSQMMMTHSRGEGGSAGPHGHGDRNAHAAAMARELQQIHNQLRAEIDQQQNQVAQLAAQLRAMKEQGEAAHHGQHPGHPSQGARQGNPGQQGHNQQPGQGNARKEKDRGPGSEQGGVPAEKKSDRS